MANFYLDISAVGNEYQAYADTPATWGVPQDGNGKAGPGHSAAVSVATLDCTSAQGDGSQTLSVLGVTVSDASSGSGATLAASLAASINNTSTAVSSTYSALLLPLNKLIFARQNPGNTAQVQIMLRIAGEDWNGVVLTHAGFTTGPTVSNFSGGSDGPFGYFCNTSSVFGKAALNYGVLLSSVASVTNPAASSDVVHVRTSRGGSSLSLTSATSAATLFRPPTSQNRFFLFDNGSLWGGDNGVFTWTVQITGGSPYPFIASQGTSPFFLRMSALNRGGLKIVFISTSVSYYLRIGGAGTRCEFTNVEFSESNTSSLLWVDVTSLAIQQKFTSCDFYLKTAHRMVDIGSYTANSTCLFDGCNFYWTGIGTNVTGIVAGLPSSANYARTFVRFINCGFSVDGGSYSLTNPYSGGGLSYKSPFEIVFSNCRGLLNPSAGLPASTLYGSPVFLWDGADNSRQFRYECMNYTLDWLNDGTYPTYNTQVASGAYISNRLTWESLRFPDGQSISVGRYGVWYRDSDAVKTVTLELLVPSDEIPTKAQIAISVKYTGSDGGVYYENSSEPYGNHSAGLSAALDNGVGISAWSLNGVSGVASKRLTVTTTNAVKENTEITAELLINGPPTANRVIYINPDLVLS